MVMWWIFGFRVTKGGNLPKRICVHQEGEEVSPRPHSTQQAATMASQQTKITFVLKVPVYREMTFETFKTQYSGAEDAWANLIAQAKNGEIVEEASAGFDADDEDWDDLEAEFQEWVDETIEDAAEKAWAKKEEELEDQVEEMYKDFPESEEKTAAMKATLDTLVRLAKTAKRLNEAREAGEKV